MRLPACSSRESDKTESCFTYRTHGPAGVPNRSHAQRMLQGCQCSCGTNSAERGGTRGMRPPRRSPRRRPPPAEIHRGANHHVAAQEAQPDELSKSRNSNSEIQRSFGIRAFNYEFRVSGFLRNSNLEFRVYLGGSVWKPGVTLSTSGETSRPALPMLQVIPPRRIC